MSSLPLARTNIPVIGTTTWLLRKHANSIINFSAYSCKWFYDLIAVSLFLIPDAIHVPTVHVYFIIVGL